jgi:opacity protein-like surface antigen
MKKTLIAAAACAAALCAAQPAFAAATVQSCTSNTTNTCTITFNGSTGQYGNSTVTRSPFSDSYLFDLGTGLLSLDLTTTFANATQDIDFSLVQVGTGGNMINVPFVMGTDETYRITGLAVTAGTYMLNLTGARDGGNNNSAFRASYTGNIAFAATPAVPEPATWAMMILGMGAVGFAMRSAKRRSNVKFDAKIKAITAGALA